MKQTLKKMVGTFLLASSLLCPNLAFAQDNAIVNSSVKYLSQTQEIPDSGVRPHAILLDTTIGLNNGESSTSFDYHGGEKIRFSITNYGTSEVHYSVRYPSGLYLIGSANGGNTLKPGASDLFSALDVEGVHGSDAYGTYDIHMYTTDGSSGSVGVKVRTVY